MDPRLQLMLMLSDRAFLALKNMQDAAKLTKEQALVGIQKERARKDNLVEEVTLP